MKPKYLWIIGVVTLGLLAAYGQHNGSSSPQPGGQAGRYQLFQGQFDVAGATGQKGTAVFRIDTVTGETTYFINGIGNNGAPVQYWSPIIQNWTPSKP